MNSSETFHPEPITLLTARARELQFLVGIGENDPLRKSFQQLGSNFICLSFIIF
jgi:hypothetical protein